MAVELIGYNLEDMALALNAMESSLKTGEQARLRLSTEGLPSENNLESAYQNLIANGFHVSRPTAYLDEGVAITDLVLTKGSPQWVGLIPLIVPIFTIGLIAFGIMKIETIAGAVVKVLIVSGVVVLLLAIAVRKPVEKYIERGGKIPLAPATVPRDIEQKVRGLWNKACSWEKIPPESKFVVFSNDNPYTREYNKAVGELLRYKQFQTGEWKPAVTKSKKALAASLR